MGVFTLLRHLMGSRSAILALGAHPGAWLVGLLFVLSAGFAREYDNEDLLHDWWYLLIPLAASIASSFILFCVFRVGEGGPPFFAAYRAFLGLFWLTAPLAWLYAIPYERMLNPEDATHANLATLGLVSAWRVALMVRVGVVVFGMSAGAAFSRVLAYASFAALAALFFLPFSIIEIMGGVSHLTAAEKMVREAAEAVGCLGCPIFVICVVVVAGSTPTPNQWNIRAHEKDVPQSVSWPLWTLAFLSLAIWIPILPFTQPEQQLRRQVQAAFDRGDFADALVQMSAHSPDDFPPHWEPPPRYLRGERLSIVVDIWEEILLADPAPWVRLRYLEKLKSHIADSHWIDDARLANLLIRLPEGETLLAELSDWKFDRLKTHLPEDLRDRVQASRDKRAQAMD